MKTLDERFWRFVDKRSGDECWPWTGTIIRQGRGRIWNGGRMMIAAHAALVVAGVDVPKGMVVCHRCDNPNCVNPKHLFVSTQRDNLLDASSKKRLAGQSKTHCLRGHELVGTNLIIEYRGMRKCRECQNMHQRTYDRKRRAALGQP